MNSKDADIMYQVYSKMMEINDIVKKHNLEERVISAMIFGIIDSKDFNSDNEMVEMQSVFDYNIINKEELETIISAIRESYEEPDDLDDLLSGLNIYLN